MSKINKDNYELYFLRYIEDRLSVEERKEVEEFLLQNPELKQEMDLYDASLVIERNDDLVFEHKDMLLHQTTSKILPMWVKYSSVAAVALVVIMIGWNLMISNNASEKIIIAENIEKENVSFIEDNDDNDIWVSDDDEDNNAVLEKTVQDKHQDNDNITTKINATNNEWNNVKVANEEILYLAENKVDEPEINADDAEVEDIDNMPVVIEIHTDALAEIINENIEDTEDMETVVVETHSYALADYVVDFNDEYHYSTDDYELALNEKEDIWDRFTKLTESLFSYGKNKAERNFGKYIDFISNEYATTKEKFNRYLAENVNKYIAK